MKKLHGGSPQKAFEQAMRRLFEEQIPFDRVLGIQVASLDPDNARLRFDMREDLVGNFLHGQLHGGVISATLDVTGGFAVMLRMARDKPQDSLEAQLSHFRRLGTIDLRVDYIRPGKGAHFIASARVLRLGSRVAPVRMELVNDRGELIASGAGAYMVG